MLVCGQLPWAVGRDGRVEDLDALLNAQYDVPKGCDMSNGTSRRPLSLSLPYLLTCIDSLCRMQKFNSTHDCTQEKEACHNIRNQKSSMDSRRIHGSSSLFIKGTSSRSRYHTIVIHI